MGEVVRREEEERARVLAPLGASVSTSRDGMAARLEAGGAALTLSLVWLLDNGRGARGRDAASGQRLADAGELLAEAAALAVEACEWRWCASGGGGGGGGSDSDGAQPPLSPAARFVTTGVFAPTPEAEPTLCVRVGPRGEGGEAGAGAGETLLVPLALLRDCARRAQPAAPELPLRDGGGVGGVGGFGGGEGGFGGGEGGFGGGEVGGGVEGAASAFELAAAWHEYSALTASPAARAAAHAQLRACGLVRVRGAPAEPGAGVLGVARLFGIVAETNYGLVFDVRAEAAPTNLAFSARGLGMHTDNPYRRPAPGFQALLCLQPAASGGVTAFADGAAAARALRAADPAAFRLLSGTDATFRFADGAAQLEATRPVIALGRGGEVRSVAVNNRGMAPLAVGGGGAAAGSAEYYRALAEFARLAEQPRFGLRVRLERGEAALWDNARLLHGRSGFAGGARWLQGCYLSADSVESNAAVALDRGGAS